MKFSILFIAAVLCIAAAQARLSSRYGQRYLTRQRYQPRLAQYNRYTPRYGQYRAGHRYGRLVDEVEEPVAFDEPEVFADEVPVVLTEAEESAASEDVPVLVAPEDQGLRVVPVVPVARKPAKPSPASYFALDFGQVTQGAVALANSYSTGENGQASSRSLAAGNPNLDAKLRAEFFEK